MSNEQLFETFAADRRAWCIYGAMPAAIWDRVQRFYIEPLRAFGKAHGVWLVPSARSCYRSPEHELKRGRSGTSMHCFPPGTRGACDLVTVDGTAISGHLPTIKAFAPFNRIAWYPANGFIHVDYGERSVRKGRTYYMCASPVSAWRFIATLPPLNTV
jgi:hypothetical protein